MTKGYSSDDTDEAVQANIVAAGYGYPAPCPCDIFEAGGTPCVAAHSTVRALFATYAGPLYQVQNLDTHETQDIGILTPGGFANSAVQEQFCAKAKQSKCVISRIYDQTKYKNHLDVAPAGLSWTHPDHPADAMKNKIAVGGHAVYGVFIGELVGYRNDNATGTAVGDEPETIYAVLDGQHYNKECCFDYGNAQKNYSDAVFDGSMEAVYFGTTGEGEGSGPWVMADLNNGLFASDKGTKSNEASITAKFVTGMVKGNVSTTPEGHFAVKGGNAQSGKLKTYWDGPRPYKGTKNTWNPSNTTQGYVPMQKQGGIVLGIGGSNWPNGTGTFYEGVMTKGYSSDDTDEAVQANIVATGYGVKAAACPNGYELAFVDSWCQDTPLFTNIDTQDS